MKRYWKKGLFLLALMCLLIPGSVQAAWKTTSAGTMYTIKKSPGYYTGWHTIDGARYYFSSKGIMATGWKKVSKKYYYFGTDGKMRKGFQKIGDKIYYLGNDGVRRTGMQKINSGQAMLYYYFNKKGVMQTGVVTVDKLQYFFNASGIRQYGYIQYNNNVYYADKTTGVLACQQWIGDYYFQKDCSMARNAWVNGKWVGADGKFTGVTNYVGWITEGGKTYYYSRANVKVKGFLSLDNKRYYLDPISGALRTGWFTAGEYTYYSDESGVIQTSKWMGKKYLLRSGAMATGWLTIGSKRFYFNPSTGVRVTKWNKIDDKYYYFSKKGVLTTNKWVGKKYYVGEDGARATGLKKIGKKYYYFSTVNAGTLLKGWVKVSGNILYYANKKGVVKRNKFVKSGGYKYYAGADCRMIKGLRKIKSHRYYFDMVTFRMAKNKKLTVNGATYYFTGNGRAATNQWVKIDKKYYYFDGEGEMATNMRIGNYYVGADGVRSASQITTSIKLKNGKYYGTDSTGAKLKGWAVVNGSKYYFNNSGIALTGLQVLGSKKYYFFPTGVLATDLTLAVGSKEYTINKSGVITKETTINVSGNTLGSQIAKFALKYVGNKYVYGGTSLTNGADCSGFCQTVFAKFGIKLLRVADDQMKGPNSSYINMGYKKAVVVATSSRKPGDLIFYGSSNYASHVAIYIGDNKIVHASNSRPYPEGGIKISNYDYQTPVRIVRYWS